MNKIDFWKDVEGYEKYDYSAGRGKKRIEEMEKYFDEIEQFLSGNKRFLKGKILDVGCGGGVFSLWLASKDYSVIGIDNNKEMIRIAIREEKKHKFKAQFINADAAKVKLDLKFDSFLIFGNTLGVISLMSFVDIMKNLERLLKEKGFVLISYNDYFKSILRNEPYYIFTTKDLLNIYGNYSNSDNSVELISVSFDGRGVIKTKFYVWSSQILQALMLSLGFKLVKRIDTKAENVTTLDVYQKI